MVRGNLRDKFQEGRSLSHSELEYWGALERVKVERTLGAGTEDRKRTAQVVCGSESSEGTCARCLATVLETCLGLRRENKDSRHQGRGSHTAYYAKAAPCICITLLHNQG